MQIAIDILVNGEGGVNETDNPKCPITELWDSNRTVVTTVRSRHRDQDSLIWPKSHSGLQSPREYAKMGSFDWLKMSPGQMSTSALNEI